MIDFEGYALKDEILRYTHRLVAEIRSPRKREAVREEYAAHIEDAMTAYMLGGMTEEEAFARVCEELGKPTMIAELLGVTHNRDPLPSFVKWLLAGAAVLALVLVYVFVDNRALRSWIMLAFQLGILGFGIFGIYLLYRLVHALRARRGTLRKLRAFADAHGLSLTVRERGMRGLLAPTPYADVILDTPSRRYILSLWGTLYGKRHLHLTDIGLYSYSAVIGYANLLTRVHALLHSGAPTALPKGFAYFSITHTNLVDVPRGMHLLPKVDFEAWEHPEKENVRVLLLSPVPFRTSALVGGRENELGDGDVFEGCVVYSTVGFLSYLNGERIRTDGKF